MSKETRTGLHLGSRNPRSARSEQTVMQPSRTFGESSEKEGRAAVCPFRSQAQQHLRPARHVNAGLGN